MDARFSFSRLNLIGIDEIDVGGRMHDQVHLIAEKEIVLLRETKLHQRHIAGDHANTTSESIYKVCLVFFIRLGELLEFLLDFRGKEAVFSQRRLHSIYGRITGRVAYEANYTTLKRESIF